MKVKKIKTDCSKTPLDYMHHQQMVTRHRKCKYNCWNVYKLHCLLHVIRCVLCKSLTYKTGFIIPKTVYTLLQSQLIRKIAAGLDRSRQGVKRGVVGSKIGRFQNLSFHDVTKPPTTPFFMCSKVSLYMYKGETYKNFSSVHTFDLADCSRYDLVFAISKMTYSQLDRNSSTVICFRDDWL